jgi:outer membrane protein assembly factor BamA
MVLLATLLLAGVGVIAPVAAADATSGSVDQALLTGLPVQTITIEGLRKTREPVVRDLIPAAVGDTFTTATVQSVTDALVDSDLFAEVVVSAIPLRMALSWWSPSTRSGRSSRYRSSPPTAAPLTAG